MKKTHIKMLVNVQSKNGLETSNKLFSQFQEKNAYTTNKTLTCSTV